MLFKIFSNNSTDKPQTNVCKQCDKKFIKTAPLIRHKHTKHKTHLNVNNVI